MRRLLACCVATALLATIPVLGELPPKKKTPSFDWPQWLGPDRTAISHETGLLKKWPEEGPRLVWKAEGLGKGYSTPSVAAGRIFTMGNRDDEEFVIAVSAKNGKELWATSVGQVRSNGGGYPGPRCTPTVDGKHLYVLGINGDMLCLDVATGKEIWRVDVVDKFQGRVGGWGYCESPLVDGDRVLCTPGGEEAAIVALDKKTGKTIWVAATPDGEGSAHYSSIIIANVKNQKQYVQFLGGGVIGVSAEGKFLWRYTKPSSHNCSTPIYHDEHVFAASSYGKGGGLVRLIPEGNTCKAEEVYFTKKMQNHHGGMVLVGDYLYGSNEQSVTCLEFKTGKIMWESREPGKGSIAYADGMLYYRNEGGPLILFEANPKQYVERGRFEQPDRSEDQAWQHPVIANGKMYIRDADILLCFDIKEKK